jgi:hypothetical protein
MEVQHIDYAPRSANYGRQRLWRRVITVAVAAIIVPVGIKCGVAAFWRAELLYWQGRALQHLEPADQVVFEGDAKQVAAFAKSPDFILDGPGSNPPCFKPAHAWERFYALLSPPGRRLKPTWFLHELRNATGEPRLVVVEGDLSYYRKEGCGGVFLDPLVFRPGSAFSSPIEISSGSAGLFQDGVVRCYAGQADPADSSHFTITIVVGRQTKIVDGWLKDDDSVALKVREPAISYPRPGALARQGR